MNLPVPATQGPRRTDGSTSGSFAGSSAAQPGEAGVRQRRAGDVADDAGEVADLAAGVEQARLLVSFGAVAQEFHSVPSGQMLVQPPSITWATPVVKPLSSEAR